MVWWSISKHLGGESRNRSPFVLGDRPRSRRTDFALKENMTASAILKGHPPRLRNRAFENEQETWYADRKVAFPKCPDTLFDEKLPQSELAGRKQALR